MPTLNVNHFFGSFDLDLRDDGVLDEDVEYAFKAGHCHSFALAVHDRFGWPLVGVGWNEQDGWSPEDGTELPARSIPEHVLILHPELGLIDVTGEYDGSLGDDHAPVDPWDALQGLDGWYRPADPDTAALYVDDWANRLGLAA